MGIYISGVKGLPEQVQKNKEDIKTIQEEIEGIDFEEIRQLENQVAENTQDINNLENGQGVQDQAINGLEGRLTTAEGTIGDQGDAITDLGNDIGALQTKTQSLSYEEFLGFTNLDGGFVSTAGTLTLLFTGAGLKINGQPVGKSYYRHYISFTYSGNNYNFTIVSSQAEAYDFATLLTYMYNQGFTASDKNIHNAKKSSVFNLDYYYYASQTNLYAEVFKDGAFLRKDTMNGLTITDSVVGI